MSLVFDSDSPTVVSVCAAMNYGERCGSGVIDILLYHYTGMSDSDVALRWLCCEESGVSSHYFIYEDGRIVQLVPESYRAHHAGVGCWRGETDINSCSIGIELANAGHSHAPLPSFPPAQMESLARLSMDILSRHPIPPERVLGHSDIAPLRKSDPGELFDWQWLHSRGIGHYVPPVALCEGVSHSEGDSGESILEFQNLLRTYGYDCPTHGDFDSTTTSIVCAFQRHFRPLRVDGIVDFSTLSTLRNLVLSLDV